MKRLLPGAWLAASCGLFSIFLLGGCPGTLDPGVGVGLGGMGGMTGGDGCQVAVLQSSCSGCHFSANGSAGLDLASGDIGARLLGADSSTDTQLSAACMGRKLLNAGTNPATGLFVDKLGTPDCGSKMPIGLPLTATQITCLTDWATTITSPPAAFTEEETR